MPASGTTSALRKGHLVLHALLVLYLFALIGCTLTQSFLFLPKKGITATPASSGIAYHEVWFQARDGVPLNGWFIAGAPAMPLILFFHGNGSNLSDNLQYLEMLHSQGFAIFIFDYRGYGKSGGQPLRERDLYRDARGAVSYLRGQGWRHEGMIFYGQSLGAAVALQMALESPPAGLVMESSFTCIKDMLRQASPFSYYLIGWWDSAMAFDNLAKIATVGVPLLMIHGENDAVIPVQMTRRLFARAADPKMLYIVTGGGHCNALTVDSSAYLATWNSYLQTLTVRIAAGRGVRP
ncbi:MAG: hypothetical protein A2075_09815 [Geobacteraceae bacterium GWC2_58_44]|nr:MAG: hypothetical protein A2075_09815 [Geobacteraceae bacterium GWC2_58_44]HBG06987.1 hypothetical protein [Geobacter sp.]